jgi:hypothetical protein
VDKGFNQKNISNNAIKLFEKLRITWAEDIKFGFVFIKQHFLLPKKIRL